MTGARTSHRLSFGVAVALVTALAPACSGTSFAPSEIIKTWRPLAIVADPPEAAPGQDVTFHALLSDPDGVDVIDPSSRGLTYTWTACFRADSPGPISGAQYNATEPAEGCDPGAEGVVALETLPDGVGRVDGTATAAFFSHLDVLAAALGGQITPAQVQQIADQVGFPLTVQLTVTQGDKVLMRAYKRFIVSTRDTPNTNPPPPRFQIGKDGPWVSGRGVSAPFECDPEDGTTPVIDAGAKVILGPATDDDSWRETYEVLDIRGSIVPEQEGAFYNWYGTAGAFDQDVTYAPVRDNVWTTPKTPGTYPLWLVVRDGHGGTSACRTEVEVR